jgi:hypothetical protein
MRRSGEIKRRHSNKVRIYRGIVARWKADGPEEQVGVYKTINGQKSNIQVNIKLFSQITQPLRIVSVIVKESWGQHYRQAHGTSVPVPPKKKHEQ